VSLAYRRAAADALIVGLVTNAPVVNSELVTARERDVIELIAQGYTNQQIAFELTLTPGTVANYVARILGKLGLESRTQVAVWATRQGIGG
jgi:DNA-binding NarL/FixJ family response regulator